MDKNKTKSSLAVWNIKAKNFPQKGKLESKLKFLINYAILAASGFNSQPWKFKIDKNLIEIWPDWQRVRQEVDPDNRELFISLGCAAANLEVAAKYFGLIFEKNYLKTSADPVISFVFKEGKTISQEKVRFEMISQRRVNRGDYTNEKIAAGLINDILKINKEYKGVKVDLFSQKSQLSIIGKLIEKSNKIWFKSKKLVEELEFWLKDDLEHSNEKGLSTGTLNLYKLAIEMKYLLKGDEAAVKRKAEKDRKLAEAAAAIGIISTDKDRPIDWVKSGEMYQKLALDLTANNIQNAFFNAVIELKTQRKKLEKILKTKGRAQLIFRLGYSKTKVSHSTRRPIDQVIIM